MSDSQPAREEIRRLAARLHSLHTDLTRLADQLDSEFDAAKWADFSATVLEAQQSLSVSAEEQNAILPGVPSGLRKRLLNEIDWLYRLARDRRRPTTLSEFRAGIEEVGRVARQLDEAALSDDSEMVFAAVAGGLFCMAAAGVAVVNGLYSHLATIPPAAIVLAQGAEFFRKAIAKGFWD